MKGMLRRALGVAAAAAMAVTGAVALAGTANAASGSEHITITAEDANAIDGHTFKYVQIASYDSIDDGKYTNLHTVAGTDNAIYDAVTNAVDSVFTDQGNTLPDNVDPLVWAQGVSGKPMGDNSDFPWANDSRSRSFAQSLADSLDTTENENLWANAPAAKDGQVQITDLYNGLYLIVDTYEGTDASDTLPMLVATEDGGASVVVKNQRTGTPPEKTVTDAAGGSITTVTQGQKVEFAIKGKVPATAGAAVGYAYVFTDYANDGITIDLDSVKVYYGNSEPQTQLSDFTVAVGGQLITKGQKVTGNASNTNGANVPTFTVSVPKSTLDTIQQYAGEPLVVKYEATVTTTVKTVDNWATVTSGENTSEPGRAPTLTSADLTFTKVGENGAGLENVTFSIAGKDGTSLPEGYPTTATSNEQGVVAFPNLADGVYTITETSNPDKDYLNMGLSFDVTITTKDGVATITLGDESAQKWAGLDYDLVTQASTTDGGAITVQNIKSITQLPLTGAAGTMLFTVLGLLIAGAGVTVYMKSRSMRHMLRG